MPTAVKTPVWFSCLFLLLWPCIVSGQSAPDSPGHIWTSPQQGRIEKLAEAIGGNGFKIDASRTYSLPDLIDLAEEHNPETRLGWERAKAQAAALGIARSEWYPILGALATAQVSRQAILLGTDYVRQTVFSGEPALNLSYTLLDFGRRSARVAFASAELLAADFSFNDTHRRVIFQVEQSYYRVLSTAAQQQAAEANLKNAQAVEASAQERLDHGLATLPDVLEARSATAQAQFDLQTAIGALEIARGDLATSIGTSASAVIPLEPVPSIETPSSLPDSVEQLIARALKQRPDLLQQVSDLSATQAAVREARSAYYPKLDFNVLAGFQYLNGFQEQLPFTETSLLDGVMSATFSWNIFDPSRRSNLERTQAESRAAAAQIDSTRNQISDEVWRAYSNVKTAFRQREAATALLHAAEQSYDAATEAYKYGVRNLLDVTAAQRTLALARTADISARTQVLTSLADLAFRTGDLQTTGRKPAKP